MDFKYSFLIEFVFFSRISLNSNSNYICIYKWKKSIEVYELVSEVNILAIKHLKSNLIQEKRSIGIGIIIYFLSLVIVLITVIWYVLTFGGGIFGSGLLNLLFIEGILSFPAIPSAFITSYLSKKRFTGLLTVIISGLAVISLISLIIGIILLGEILGPPPIDHYEEASRGFLFLFSFFLYLFFIIPIAVISATFAVLTEFMSQ